MSTRSASTHLKFRRAFQKYSFLLIQFSNRFKPHTTFCNSKSTKGVLVSCQSICDWIWVRLYAKLGSSDHRLQLVCTCFRRVHVYQSREFICTSIQDSWKLAARFRRALRNWRILIFQRLIELSDQVFGKYGSKDSFNYVHAWPIVFHCRLINEIFAMSNMEGMLWKWTNYFSGKSLTLTYFGKTSFGNNICVYLA